MRAFVTLVVSAWAAILAAPAPALAIDAAGAKAIEEAFADYVGQGAVERGIVSAAPDGDAYRLTLDLGKLVEDAAPGSSVAVKLTPFVQRVTPRPDGTYSLTADNYPSGSLHWSKDGQAEDLTFSVEGYRQVATFDPRLKALTAAEASMKEIRFALHDAQGQTIEGGYGATMLEIKATPAAGGSVDATMRQASESFSETVTLGAGRPGQSVTLESGAAELVAEVAGLRSAAIFDVIASLAAGPSALSGSGLEGLRAKLVAALPLQGASSMRFEMKDVVVETAAGAFKVQRFTQSVDGNGLVKDGRVGVRIGFAGLAPPLEILPQWMEGLLPQELDLAIAASDLDLDGLAHLAITRFDPAQTGGFSPEAKAEIAALLAKGRLSLSIPPSSARLQTMSVALEGKAAIMPGPPTGSMTITADGLDATLKALAQGKGGAGDQNRKQAMMSLGIARNLAKPGEGGKLSWTIEAAADGSVSVNGQQLKPPAQ